MKRIALLAGAVAMVAAGQTQVDLRTQAKSVDFSAVNPTKPMTTGSAVPSTCTVGQMFFLTTGPSGQNVYGCVATNTWSLEAGGGGGSSGVTVDNSGTFVGTTSTLNFTAGAGELFTISSTGPSVSIQSMADTAIVSTLASEQAGATLLCASSGGTTTAYVCAMSPTLTHYSTGMLLRWKLNTTGTGGATTLNIDTLGATPLKLADGATDPIAGDLVAGRIYQIWYDGTSFRLLAPFFPQGVLGEALPTCAAATRGRIWYVAGTTGVKDSFSVCGKDAANAYAWRTLY